MTRPTPKAWLTISSRPKAIPYPGSGQDGSTHFAFRPLKGKPEEVASIHEVQDDPALKQLLLDFNERSTGVFTVGCEKSFNYADRDKYWAKGYVEFAINDKGLVADAQHYFAMFFHFNRFMLEHKFDEPVTFHWELEPAQFLDADIGGYTAAVWIIVSSQESAGRVREIWVSSLAFLTDVVCGGRPRPDAEPIY